MAEYLNAKCKVCGIPYHLCSDCAKTKTFTPWRSIACSINCYKIYTALSMHTNGRSTKEETKNILKKCDLSNLDSFVDNIKSSIKNILKNERPKRKTKSKKTTKTNADIVNRAIKDDNIQNVNIE